jgi:hypothetical protein
MLCRQWDRYLISDTLIVMLEFMAKNVATLILDPKEDPSLRHYDTRFGCWR